MNTSQVGTAFTVLKRIVRPSMSAICLFITYDCNQKCRSCTVWSINRDNPELRKKEMTLEQVQQFAEANPGLIWIRVEGGEPFIRKDLKFILEVLSNIPSLKLLSITSNGSLTDKMEDDLVTFFRWNRNKQLTVSIQVSFQGTEGLHTDHTGSSNSFTKAVESFDMLTKLTKEYPQLESKVQYLFTKANQGHLEDFLGSLNSSKPPFGDVLVGIATNGAFYDLDIDVAPEKESVIRELNWLSSKCSLRDKLNLKSFLSRQAHLKIINNSRQWGCAALRTSCTVDPYWNIRPCLYLYNKTFGNLADYGYSIKELAEETQNVWEPTTARCYKVGGCRSDCEANSSLLFRPWNLLRGGNNGR